MNIEDKIEEKYTNWLNCETDELDFTIEEAKFILKNDKKVHFVDELLEKSWETVLSELEKKDDQIEYVKNEYGRTIEEKDKVINEMAEQLVGLSIYDEKEVIVIFKNEEEVKEYFTNKVEREGK